MSKFTKDYYCDKADCPCGGPGLPPSSREKSANASLIALTLEHKYEEEKRRCALLIEAMGLMRKKYPLNDGGKCWYCSKRSPELVIHEKCMKPYQKWYKSNPKHAKFPIRLATPLPTEEKKS